MRKFSKDALSYFDLDKLDEPLSKEIQEIFSKNISNEVYALMIVPEDKSVLFHRKYIGLHLASSTPSGCLALSGTRTSDGWRSREQSATCAICSSMLASTALTSHVGIL